MVHAGRHKRKKQRGADVAGQNPNDRILRHAGPAEQLYDPAGGVTEQRHDENHVGRHTQKHGEQRRENHIDGLGHAGANGFFHIGDQQSAGDDGQNATLAAAQDGIQGDFGVVKAHEHGDEVDSLQRCDHTQHAAQNRRPAEALGSAVACPGGKEGHHGTVNQRQNLINEGPHGDIRIVRHGLRNERGDAGAESGTDDAGQQRDKNITDNSKPIADSEFIHCSDLLSAEGSSETKESGFPR